ncbi:protein bride of sevenless isoform X1 [Neodiprion fabricii]|uniref:protein bride of sevenless isoform X1 n=1 Tax=Neodiprion fabricii TaxID=2872261 RepID=UPI001ED8DEF3|nr:protein bride of sevenless isoform X1 [Neodiprion fabricii]
MNDASIKAGIRHGDSDAFHSNRFKRSRYRVRERLLNMREKPNPFGSERGRDHRRVSIAFSVFADTNYGPDCNVSSPKGFQEVTTALYVVEKLNKYDYIPGLTLGVKIRDSCHDKMAVFKEALMVAVEQDCTSYYELGILVPNEYRETLEPLEQFSLVPMSSYSDQNFSKPLVSIMVDFLSTKYEVVDLFLSNSPDVLNVFLDTSRKAGICLKSHTEILDTDNSTHVVIAVAGSKDEIKIWIENGEKIIGPEITWVVLPLDGSHVDDHVPPGSYIIKTEPFDFDLLEEFSSSDTFLRTAGESVIHSPYLLSIGKAIVETARSLQELQKTCPNGAKCVLPRFNSRKKTSMMYNEVYDALHILPKAHSVKYIVTMKKLREEEEEVIAYKINAVTSEITSDLHISRMPKLCVRKYANSCEKCSNFHRSIGEPGHGRNRDARGILKTSLWIPIILTVVACGTVACLIIIVFIVYRYIVDEVLDGNPALTIVLILSTIFMLQSVIPFCMNDATFGVEHLNSRKILVTSMSIGIAFSIMLSRALFLAFSVGGIFTTHINGYLQGLMVFFVSSVQITISTMFFVLNKNDSGKIIRSCTFVALLSYDIFLLLKLFVVCCFIAQIQRNYREGKCFFGTVIGLLIVWAVWITCFILVEPETRDCVVSFGVIASAYLIILGVLIPRTYYMVTRLGQDKTLSARYEPEDYTVDPRTNTIARQFPYLQSHQALYDYTFPGSTAAAGVASLPTVAYHPNYYGCSSPNSRFVPRSVSPYVRQRPGYNNYAFNSEMREVDHLQPVPRVCVENTEGRRSPIGRSSKEMNVDHPRRFRESRIGLDDRDCTETDIYVEGRLSPNVRGPDEAYPTRCSSPRLGLTESAIREEEENDVARITKF